MSRRASYMGLGTPQLQIEYLSTASTVVTLTDDQQSKLLIWNGHDTSAVRINMPAPETGMQYSVYFQGDAISSGTKFIASSIAEYDFYLVDGTTAEVFAAADGSTVEGGVGVTMIAITDYRWIVDKWGCSTYAFAVTNGSTST